MFAFQCTVRATVAGFAAGSSGHLSENVSLQLERLENVLTDAINLQVINVMRVHFCYLMGWTVYFMDHISSCYSCFLFYCFLYLILIFVLLALMQLVPSLKITPEFMLLFFYPDAKVHASFSLPTFMHAHACRAVCVGAGVGVFLCARHLPMLFKCCCAL